MNENAIQQLGYQPLGNPHLKVECKSLLESNGIPSIGYF